MILTIRELFSFDFEILKQQHQLPTSMPLNHFHNAFEMYYLCQGERYYYVDNKTYHIKKGDFVLINEYTPHRGIAAGDSSFGHILINFKKAYLNEFVKITSESLYECFTKGIHIIHLDEKEQVIIENLFDTMLEEFHHKAPWHDYYLKTLLVQLLLLTRRFAKDTPEYSKAPTGSTYKIINEATGYINDHFSDDITLEFISNKFFISTHYFSRIFKKITGVSFIEYLNNVRTKSSQKLLVSTNLSISEIAARVGYKSNTHFGRIFKKTIGISPSEYRTEYRKHTDV